MKELLGTVTSKGQVTLPVEVRRHLRVKTADKVAFIIDEDGTVRVRVPTYPTIASVSGAAGSLPDALAWHELRDIARGERLTRQYGKPHE